MTTRPDRRTVLHRLAALAAAAPATALASPGTDAAAKLYRHAVVIDGNLVPPMDPSGPLDRALSAQVRSSGLTALKMTIGGSGDGYADTRKAIEDVGRAIDLSRGLYRRVVDAKDIAAAKRANSIGVIYSFEGVAMLEGRLDRIEEFRRMGVRVMQLSYNTPSPFATGVMSPAAGSGLTPLGREAIARMNALGVTLDLSHADTPSTLQAVAASTRPPVVTHAGCAAVNAHPRNKPDTVLTAVADRGGVFGIYDLPYLSPETRQPTLGDYMAHMTHALDRCGEDHVGIGSDAIMTGFDTSPANLADYAKSVADRKAKGIGAPGEDRPPYVVGLNRPDRCAVIARELLRRGHPARVAEKVLGKNWARVFAETWSVGG